MTTVTVIVVVAWSMTGYFSARFWFRKTTAAIESYYGRQKEGRLTDGVMASYSCWMGPLAFVFGWYLHTTSPHVYVANIYSNKAP